MAAVSAVAANAPHESGTYVLKLSDGAGNAEAGSDERKETRSSRY